MPTAHRLLAALFGAFAVAVVRPPSAQAQITSEVEIRDGVGSALVRNASRKTVRVEIALWESDESGDRVRLLREAEIELWPPEARLLPGETQTVRFLARKDVYAPDTLLRLETRFIPAQGQLVPVAEGTPAPSGTSARLKIVTRVLSKVWVR